MSEKTSTRKASDTPIRWTAPLQGVGEHTILRLPDDASGRLPSRGQVAVDALVNDHHFRAVVEPDGERGHWLKIDKAMRTTLSISEGDKVTVELAPTSDWPEPDIPGDLQAALADSPDITGLWSEITPMARWEWVRWVRATKNPETRERRVEVSISKLRAGKRRPCCFDLSACTDPDLSKSGKLVDSDAAR